jgi:hypothetical protein
MVQLAPYPTFGPEIAVVPEAAGRDTVPLSLLVAFLQASARLKDVVLLPGQI